MKKLLFALFLATTSLTFSYATMGDVAPTTAVEQGDTEGSQDQKICYDLKKNMGPVNKGTYRNADKYTDGEVTKLQQFLHDEDYLTPEPTGYFGAKTKAAVIRYQTHKGFDIISGYVGPTTRAAIKTDSCTDGADTEDDVVSTSSTTTPDVVKGTVLKYDGTPAYATVRCGTSGGEYISYPVSTVDGKVSLSSHECKNKGQDVWVVCYGGRSPTLGKTTLAGFNNNTVKCLLPGEGSDVTEINPTNVSSTRLTINNCSIQVNQKTCVSGGSYANYSSNLHWLKLVNRKTGITTLSVAQPGNHSGTISLAVGEATTLSYGSNALDFADYSTGEVVTSTTATASCVSGTQWNGTVCTPSSVTGNGPTFNFTTASYTVPAGTQIRLNWYQIVGATSCVASGGWSGSKDISNSANGSSELVIVNAPTTYTLTCTNTSGGTKAKSITVQIQSTVTATGTPELILKVNNSKGPIDAVVNRFGGSGTTVLNAVWTSNVDVTNCSLGSGFRLGQTVPSLTQTSSRSGAIEGSPAYRSWVSTTPQGVDYQMSCKRISASGYSEVLWSNTVRVDTCDVGFHIVRDGSFNGGTCVTDTQTTPTCTATQTLTNGVCVDTTASVTPSLTLTPNQYVCAIKLNESTCRISVKVDSVGVNSVKYYTSVNSITSNQIIATTGNITVNFDITNGTTNVVFNGYYGSGGSNLQANRVLTATCESGTWNGSVCSGGSVSVLPTNPLIQTTKTSVSLSESFIVSWQADGATSYKLMIDGVEKGPYTQTSFSTSLATLGLSSGVHTFSVQGCNANGCGAWSASHRNAIVTGSAGSSTLSPPTITINSFSPSTITTGQSSSLSFSSTNAASCTGTGLWNGNLGGTSNPGITTGAMNTAGTFTQSITCTGAGGSATSDTKTLTVTTATGAAIKSVEMILSPKFVTKNAAASVNFSYNAKGFTVSSCDLYLTDASGSFINVGTVNDQYRSWVWGSQEYSRSIKVSCKDSSGNVAAEGVERLTVCAQASANGTGCSVVSLSGVSSVLANIGNTIKNSVANVNSAILDQGELIARTLSGATPASASSDTCTNITSNLHRGYETPSVTKLQNFLIAKGFLSEKASGFFGDLTIEAVKAYQRSVGIPQTGMVYDATREAIMVESCQ